MYMNIDVKTSSISSVLLCRNVVSSISFVCLYPCHFSMAITMWCLHTLVSLANRAYSDYAQLHINACMILFPPRYFPFFCSVSPIQCMSYATTLMSRSGSTSVFLEERILQTPSSTKSTQKSRSTSMELPSRVRTTMIPCYNYTLMVVCYTPWLPHTSSVWAGITYPLHFGNGLAYFI